MYAPATAAGDGAQMSGVDTTGPKVCVFESCVMNSDCVDPLICGRDLRCRQACATNRDCPGDDQLCVIGNDQGQKVCAKPQDIGDNLQLAAGDAGLPGNGGAGGASGASGIGGGGGASGGGGTGGGGTGGGGTGALPTVQVPANLAAILAAASTFTVQLNH